MLGLEMLSPARRLARLTSHTTTPATCVTSHITATVRLEWGWTLRHESQTLRRDCRASLTAVSRRDEKRWGRRRSCCCLRGSLGHRHPPRPTHGQLSSHRFLQVAFPQWTRQKIQDPVCVFGLPHSYDSVILKSF